MADTDSTNKTSQMKVRVKVQELLQDNLRYPTGNFRCKELNESGFLRDLFKNFELTPIKKNHEG